MSPSRLVALGGGHGLYATLSALRDLADDLTAVVTVADDGGSSGRLRDELGVPPPGDLRMALSALCEDTEWGRTWRDVLQSRFHSDGPLDGHAMGNLLIASLWEHTDDVVAGLDWVARLLRCRGTVVPLASQPLTIEASVRDGEVEHTVRGQVAVATAQGEVTGLRIVPDRPVVPQQTIEAIDRADVIFLGPGSWYTSVLTHFLVDPVAQALRRGQRRAVVILNIAHEDEETAGLERADDVRALRQMSGGFVPAVVLADAGHGGEQALREEVESWGARLVIADVADRSAHDRHHVGALREELSNIAHQVSNSAPQ